MPALENPFPRAEENLKVALPAQRHREDFEEMVTSFAMLAPVPAVADPLPPGGLKVTNSFSRGDFFFESDT